jgi:hypothetical protein
MGPGGTASHCVRSSDAAASRIRAVPRRLLALGLLLAGAATVLASRRRRSYPADISQNGGSRRRAARLQRELERG